MNSPSTILRSLVVFAICVPLAIIIGYALANPLDYSTITVMGIIALALSLPLLLRWHYPLLLLGWNLALVVPFIRGQPQLWLILVTISLSISIFERAMGMPIRFFQIPSVAWPLIALVVVALVTARLTGGFGLHAFGSQIYGGRKYVLLLVAILGYFALSARRIPVEKSRLCVALFFLGGVTQCIGDLFSIAPPWLRFIFYFFRPSDSAGLPFELGVTRLGGFAVAGFGVCCWILARYGIRGIFFSGLRWRQLGFLAAFCASFLGGFRSIFVIIVLIFAIQFFIEGLHRTQLLPIFAVGMLLIAAIAIPLASKLPYTFQRALAIFPLPIDPAARADAEYSSQWRINLWEAVLPQVPRHLLLGKGYAITPEDYEVMGPDTAFRAFDPGEQGLALAGDYHNGPLSVVLPFGLWGVAAFLAFIVAGFRVVYRNFHYGDPALRTINAGLYAYFAAKVIFFLAIYGALSTDMATFVGLLGLSAALNGGVARRVKKPVAVQTEAPRLTRFQSRLRPSFQR